MFNTQKLNEKESAFIKKQAIMEVLNDHLWFHENAEDKTIQDWADWFDKVTHSDIGREELEVIKYKFQVVLIEKYENERLDYILEEVYEIIKNTILEYKIYMDSLNH